MVNEKTLAVLANLSRLVVLLVALLSVLAFSPWIWRFSPPFSTFGDFVGFSVLVAWVSGPFLLLIIGSFIVGPSALGNLVILLTALFSGPPGMLLYFLESRALEPTGGMVVPIITGVQFGVSVIGIALALGVKWWSNRRQARRLTTR